MAWPGPGWSPCCRGARELNSGWHVQWADAKLLPHRGLVVRSFLRKPTSPASLQAAAGLHIGVTACSPASLRLLQGYTLESLPALHPNSPSHTLHLHPTLTLSAPCCPPDGLRETTPLSHHVVSIPPSCSSTVTPSLHSAAPAQAA